MAGGYSWLEMKGENNHVPVKERFGEEEEENTGLQQPSVSSQVKFGAAWADQKVFLTQIIFVLIITVCPCWRCRFSVQWGQ